MSWLSCGKRSAFFSDDPVLWQRRLRAFLPRVTASWSLWKISRWRRSLGFISLDHKNGSKVCIKKSLFNFSASSLLPKVLGNSSVFKYIWLDFFSFAIFPISFIHVSKWLIHLDLHSEGISCVVSLKKIKNKIVFHLLRLFFYSYFSVLRGFFLSLHSQVSPALKDTKAFPWDLVRSEASSQGETTETLPPGSILKASWADI